jgi:hypothetical protein
MTTTHDPTVHHGSCHCGKVRYDVKVDPRRGTACNCSICSRKGWLLTFVSEDEFTLLAGSDELTDYQFGNKRIHHLFCKHCGVNSFSRGVGPHGKEMVAVNLRCLEGVDVSAIDVAHFDGKSL